MDNVKDGAKALVAMGRLEVKEIEERLMHRLSGVARRLGLYAGVTVASAFSAVFLSQAAVDWLTLRLAPWQSHLIVGATWAVGASVALMSARRPAVPGATPAEALDAPSTEAQIAIEQDRLKQDVVSFQHEAATWFGVRPQLARWMPLSVVAGLSAAVLYLTKRPPRFP